MSRRTRAILAGGLVVAAVVAVAVGYPVAERWAVERDVRRTGSADLPPAERGALADRLRTAAARPGLSPAARVRRLDAAGLAFLRAGRAAEAKPLFRAEYDAIRATAAPDELIDALNKLNNATPSATTAEELDEVRQNHAAIRFLAARATGVTSAAIVKASPAALARHVEQYVRQSQGALTPAEKRSLLDEAVALREGALGAWQESADATALLGLAEALEQRGDRDRAVAVSERVAGFADAGAAAAFERVYRLRYPDRADPRRAAALLAWLAGRPAGEATAAIRQELGFCHLALKQYPEAAEVLGALVTRTGAEADADVLAYNLTLYAVALDNAGRKAEADAVRVRLGTAVKK